MTGKLSLALILFLVSSCVIQFAEAQCSVVKDRTNRLGYKTSNGKSLYASSCSGSCSTGGCVASAWKKITVTSRKKHKGTQSTVTVISGCSCPAGSSGGCSVNGQTFVNGATAYNSCGEKCTCVNGNLQNCCRQRKNFISLSSTERLRFLQAIHDLRMGTGGANSNLQQQFMNLVEDHHKNFNNGIHDIDQLLAWHRWYIAQYENILRQVDCRITIPYWQWENDYNNPWGSPIWGTSNDWLGSGSGGNCVPNGLFQPPFYLLPSAGSQQCLRRGRSGGLPSPSQVSSLLNTPANSFSSFFNTISGMHAGVHCAVGGTFCIDQSANAPEFVLHHGNVDKIWNDWQQKGPAYFSSYTSAVNQYMAQTSLARNVRPVDVLDLSNHLGICAQYVENSNILAVAIQSMPAEIFNSIPQTKPSWLKHARKYWRNMNMTNEEMNVILAGIDQTLNTAPTLTDEAAQNDSFAQTFGISLTGLQAAVSGWQSVAEDSELPQLQTAQAVISSLGNQVALNAFLQTNTATSTDTNPSTPASNNNNDDDDGITSGNQPSN